jgi:hypothetical protein
MEELQRHRKAEAEVRKATGRIAQFAAKQDATVPEVELDDGAREQTAADRRSEKRDKCSLPVEILVNNGSGSRVFWTEKDSHKAYICNISPTGIGLLHNKPIDARRVLLRVALENGECISLSVGLLWHRPLKEGWFSSGGKIAEAIIVAHALPALPKTEYSSLSAGHPASPPTRNVRRRAVDLTV